MSRHSYIFIAWLSNIAKIDSYGGRAFSFAAPKLWNSIPEEFKKAKTVDSFKTKLKTFLFKKAFFSFLLLYYLEN